MTISAPFSPAYGTNQTVTSAAAAASLVIIRGAKQVRIVNTGAGKAYIRISTAAAPIPATSADFCVAAGQASTISKGDQDLLSHISAAGTTLEIMAGEGY